MRLDAAVGDDFVIEEIGPNHRTVSIKRVVEEREEDAKTDPSQSPAREAKDRITEIATGMHYWDGQEWVKSNPTFEITPDGVQATHLQHKIALAGNINAAEAVRVVTRDGITLRSTPVAIGLYDSESGESLIIAVVTNSTGVLVSSNQVVFPDAFHGISASLAYTVSPSSFEQDVVITGGLDPEDYNFPPTTTRIQVYTEFYDAPQPERVRRVLRAEEKKEVRERMVTPDLVDEVLGFGEFVIATGRASRTTLNSRLDEPAAPVVKEFRQVGGRTFLVESLEYRSMEVKLRAAMEQNEEGKERVIALKDIPLPANKAQASVLKEGIRVASADFVMPEGILIDYVATIGPGLSVPTVFRGDTTYLVTGAVVCNGATTIEGGAVFKYKHLSSGGPYIKFNSTVICKTAPYRPAIFTAVDDDSVGDKLDAHPDAGYTGSINPSGYAEPALWIYYIGGFTLKNLHFRYAKEAIRIENSDSGTVEHSQLVQCVRGVVLTSSGSGGSGSGLSLFVQNSLFSGVSYPITVSKDAVATTIIASTFDAVDGRLLTVTGSSVSTFVRNSILSNIGELLSGQTTLDGANNGFYNSPLFGSTGSRIEATSIPFASAAQGNYYLSPESNFRDAGTTTGLTVSFQGELKSKTTHPPVFLDSGIYADMILSIQAPRDGGLPDLGYHYPALDYYLSQVHVSLATVTVAPGVALGVYGPTGFNLDSGSKFRSEGVPTAMNRIVRLDAVQEGLPETPATPESLFALWASGIEIELKFNEISLMAGSSAERQLIGGFDEWYNALSPFTVSHSHVNGMNQGFRSFISGTTLTLFNNVLDRTEITFGQGAVGGSSFSPISVTVYNNLFYRGSVTFAYKDNSTVWKVRDNLFHAETLSNTESTYTFDAVRNGYASGLLSLGGSPNDENLVPVYVTGPLGGLYYPASGGSTTLATLIDAGSRTREDAELYHFTVKAAQNTKEGADTSQTVDVGYHYVGVGTDNLPKDSDSDGLPDYIEDADGDGSFTDTKASTPSLAVSFNSDNSVATVTGSSSHTEVIILYTTDGSDPILTSSTIPPALTAAATVKARAYKPGLAPSDVVSLTVEAADTVSFYPFEHSPTEFANSPINVQVTSTAQAIYYRAGTTANWQTTTSGSSPEIQGIDEGTGKLEAYGFTPNKLRSVTTTSGEFCFRVPQPTHTITYSAGTATLTFNTLEDAEIDLYVNGSSTATYTLAADATGVATKEFVTPMAIHAQARKVGYVASGFTTAHINKLPPPQFVSPAGPLSEVFYAHNPIDIWLAPDLGFENAYGENGDVSGWNSHLTFSASDVPNPGFPGSFNRNGNAVTVINSKKVPLSFGRTYSMAGWFKGDGNARLYAGFADFESGVSSSINAEDVNSGAYGISYLTAQLTSGNVAYVSNPSIFTPGSPAGWYANIFEPLLNYGRTTPLQKVNQSSILKFIYQADPYSESLSYSAIAVDSQEGTVTLSRSYNGPTLPAGTVIGRRAGGGWYEYKLLSNFLLPTTWTEYQSSSFNNIRPGAEEVSLLLLMSYPGGTTSSSSMTGVGFWEGSPTDKPYIEYYVGGVAQPNTESPVKFSYDGGSAAISARQKGTYYFDSDQAVCHIIFKVANPEITADSGGCEGEVTLTATTATVGANIHYTMDGTPPTPASPAYSSPVVVSAGVITRWKAFKNNYADSDTTVHVVQQIAPPVLGHPSGTFDDPIDVTVTAPAGGQLRLLQIRPNLLNPDAWVVGTSGTQPSFPQNGATSENKVEERPTPYNSVGKVWVAYNTDIDSNADGGWNKTDIAIDRTKTYRFSVWLRKTGGASGSSYLGCKQSSVSTLNGQAGDATHTNPYFWYGFLPLNEWHLVVGYVHPAGHLGQTSFSKVYDVNGNIVFTGTDFKWLTTTTWSGHRSYLWYCTDPNVQQEFFLPRMEVVDSAEDPIDVLFQPLVSSPQGITVSRNSTIQALSCNGTDLPSSVVTATYLFQTHPPTFTHASGTYENDFDLTITASPGADLKIWQAAPNLIDASTWKLGTEGSQSGFTLNGRSEENTIDVRTTPYGTTEKVWLAHNTDTTSGPSYDADGGWNSSDFIVDKTKTYRFSVWMKRTGGTMGHSYLGCKWSTVSTLTGDSSESIHSNPYFMINNVLPINEWHLVVGYVHPAGHTGNTHYGGVYTVNKGKRFALTDFKWLNTTTVSSHRAYMFHCTDPNVEQEFWSPRVEIVDSPEAEPPLFGSALSSPQVLSLTGNDVGDLRAFSYREDWLPSELASRTYSLNVATPVLAVESNGYFSASTETIGAIIHYTTNGDEPTVLSAQYQVPLLHAPGTVLKIKAFKADYHSSETVSYPGPDSDYDGISDAEESAVGSNPLDPDSAFKRKLASWSFEPAAWAGDQGQLPVRYANITLTNPNDITPLGDPEFFSKSYANKATGTAYLQYRETDLNGQPNINRRNGTVRFWFRPAWDAQSGGPGTEARLISMGEYNSNLNDPDLSWWAVYVNNAGTTLAFHTQGDGTEQEHFAYSIGSGEYAWKKHFWHHVAITYSETSVQLYLNGELVSDTTGGTSFPSSSLREADGIYFGSDSFGEKRAYGDLDQIETFNYPLSPQKIKHDYQVLVTIDADRDGLVDVAEDGYGTNIGDYDSDNDGVDDGWEVEFQYDPTVDDMTEALRTAFRTGVHPTLAEPERGYTDVANAVQSQDSLINIDFTGDPDLVARAQTIVGGHGIGYEATPTDQWNFVTPEHSYQNRAAGTVLRTADGVEASVTLYAGVGPYAPTATAPDYWQLDGMECDSYHLSDARAHWDVNEYGWDRWKGCLEQQIAQGIRWGGVEGELLFQSPPGDPLAEVGLAWPFYHLFWSPVREMWVFPAFDTPSAFDSTENYSTTTPFTDYLMSNGARGWGSGFYPYADQETYLQQIVLAIEGLDPTKFYQVALYLHSVQDDWAFRQFDLYAKSVGTLMQQSEAGLDLYRYVLQYRDGQIYPLKADQGVDRIYPYFQERFGEFRKAPLIIRLNNVFARLAALQIVELLEPVVPKPTARVEQQNIVLKWDPVPGALSYSVYRSLNETSGFLPIGQTREPIYVDVALQPNTTYYYYVEVVGPGRQVKLPLHNPYETGVPVGPVVEETGGTAPALNYIESVEVARGGNGNFPLHYSSLLNASDAKDAEGDPIYFKVEAVLAGNLLIGGEPWSQGQLVNGQWMEGNDLIDGTQSVEWIPPMQLPNTGVDALRVSAFDGLLKSLTRATITLVPKPAARLLAWGDTAYGVLGNAKAVSVGRHEPWPTPEITPGAVIGMDNVRMATHEIVSAAVKEDGSLWMWGTQWGDEGLFGEAYVDDDGIHSIAFEFQWNENGQQVSFRDAISVSIGSSWAGGHALLLRGDGSLWSWGNNNYGQLGYDVDWQDSVSELWTTTAKPRKVDLPAGVIQAYASSGSSIALCKDGSVWWWGTIMDYDPALDQDYYFGFVPGTGSTQYPYRIPFFDSGPKVTQLAAQGGTFLALREDASVCEFGFIPRTGNATPRTYQFFSEPRIVPGLTDVTMIATSKDYSLAVLRDGTVKEWGVHPATWSLLAEPTLTPDLGNINYIAAAPSVAMAVDKHGYVWGWGWTYQGTLMSEDPWAEFPRPTLLPKLENVTAVFPSYNVCFALGNVEEGKPTRLSAVGLDAKVSLSWRNYPGASHYKVKRSDVSGGPYETVATVIETKAIDKGLLNGQGYHYVVSGLVNGVESLDSREVFVVPQPAPDAPTWSETPIDGACKSILLSWNPSTLATEFKLYRGTDENNLTQIAVTQDPGFQDFVPVQGTLYFYKVVASNASGDSEESSVQSGQTDPAACLAAPQGLYLTAGSSTVDASWQPVTGAQQYRLRWRKHKASEYSYVTTRDVFYQVTRLVNGREYLFSVCALVNGEETDWSAEVAAIPTASGDPLAPWPIQVVPGFQQIYLEWPTVPNVNTYSVEARIGGASGTIVLNKITGTTTDNRFWHTGLVNGTEYTYTIEATKHMLDSNGGTTASATSDPVYGTPDGDIDQNSQPLTFTAEAHDSLVFLYWKATGDEIPQRIPGHRFYLERKTVGNPNAAYEIITEIGAETSYWDHDVVNGTTYRYKLVDIDLNFQRAEHESADVTPVADSGLVAAAEGGNGFVALQWNDAGLLQYHIERATEPGGPYTRVGTAPAGSTSYEDASVQNGRTYYYVVSGITQFSVPVESEEKSATPSPAGRLMAPKGLRASLRADRIWLYWESVPGAVGYKVFLVNSVSSTEIYSDIKSTCEDFLEGAPIPNNTLFTYRVVAINGSNVESQPSEIDVIYNFTPETEVGNVILSVNGSTAPGAFVGPTNLVLNASLPGGTIRTVEFFTNSVPLAQAHAENGSTRVSYTWNQVPIGTHTVLAVAVAIGSDQLVRTYQSDPVTFTVDWVPELASFRHSEVDLSIPAPGIPITLARNYDSLRSADASGVLGAGWQASWDVANVTISDDLSSGWIGGDQVFGQNRLVESSPHIVTVTLPTGESIRFFPALTIEGGIGTGLDIGLWFNNISLSFAAEDSFVGRLVCQNGEELNVFRSGWSSPDWTGAEVELRGSTDEWTEDPEPFVAGQFTYITPDETSYLFTPGYPGKWELSTVTDRNGSWIKYVRANGRVEEIAHSNGRRIQFDYSQAGEVGVRDAEQKLVLKYRLGKDPLKLTEVHKLAGTEENPGFNVTKYSYGTTGDNQDRLTTITAPDGVRLLENSYNSDGTLFEQMDAAGRKSNFAIKDLDAPEDPGTISVSRCCDSEGNTINTTTIEYNSSGAIGAVQEPRDPNSASAPSSTLSYDNQGRLESETNPSGNVTLFKYDNQDRLTGQTDPLGNTTDAVYNDAGQLDYSVDARGAITDIEYENGNPTFMTDPSGIQTQFEYYDPAEVNGKAGVLKLETRTVPGFASTDRFVTEYKYYPTTLDLKEIIQRKEPPDEYNPPVRTEYTYDANGNRKRETRYRIMNGVEESLVTTFDYDGQNRLVKTTDPEGFVTQTIYNSAGRVWKTIDGLNRVTESVYDVLGNLIETRYPDGTVTRSTYDEFNRPAYVQDRARPDVDNVTKAPARMNHYNHAGRRERVERHLPILLKREVAILGTDYFGEPTTVTQYKITRTDQAATVYATSYTFYDVAGRVQYQVDERGKLTSFAYDEAGRRIRTRSFSDQSYAPQAVAGVISPSEDYADFTQTTYGYDENGNQIWVLDADADHSDQDLWDPENREHRDARTDYVYDPMNRVTDIRYPRVGDAPRSQVFYAYDGFGNKIQSVDQANVATKYTYNHQGMLAQVIQDAGGNALYTRYKYDEQGNMVAQIDAMDIGGSRTTKYEYDKVGRRTKRTLPGGNLSESTTYTQIASPDEQDDPTYRVSRKAVTDFNGNTITYTHDILDRLAEKKLGPETVTYEYTDQGQRERVLHSLSGREVEYGYDDLNRFERKHTPEGILAYTYHENGLLASIKAYRHNLVNGPEDELPAQPGSEDIHVDLAYGYDQLNRLSSVVDNKLPQANKTTTYTYYDAGSLESVVYPNGIRHTYQYTEEHRLKDLSITRGDSSLVRRFIYETAPTGHRTKVTEEWTGAETVRREVTYGYDTDALIGATLPRVYRLTQESLSYWGAPYGSVDYTYDKLGNRLARSSTIIFPNYPSLTEDTFDNLDRLDNDAHPSTVSTQFDSNGNTLYPEEGSESLNIYDLENRLISAPFSTGTVNLAYDTDGNRISKTAGGISTYYLVDDRNPTGYPQVLVEYQGTPDNAPTKVYAYGGDLISQTQSGTTHYYGYDGHGSVRMLFNDQVDGATIETDRYDYDAFGIVIIEEGSGTDNVYLYAGEQRDAELGTYCLRARYYNPELGRFLTMDKYEGNHNDPLSLHKYLYCHANPVNLVDPSGYFTSAAEVGVSLGTATRLQTLAISAAATAYVNYAIYSGAKGIYDDYRINKVAQQLGVQVEPAVYLQDLQNGTDWTRDRRTRESGWAYFAHGTSTGAWKDSTSILASGGGDFGTGFYTFKANLRGLFWAGGRATRTASSPHGGGLPFILVVKIKQEDLSGMMTSAQDLRGDSAQWTTTVTGYLNSGGQGLSGHPIVIGPVSAQGRTLNPGETPTQRAGMPDQWKWEDVSKLKPASIIPVFNGFNRKLAW